MPMEVENPWSSAKSSFYTPQARPGSSGKGLATITIRHRLSTLRTFFARIIEWDYDDAPARLPIYSSDFPALDELLPKFLSSITS